MVGDANESRAQESNAAAPGDCRSVTKSPTKELSEPRRSPRKRGHGPELPSPTQVSGDEEPETEQSKSISSTHAEQIPNNESSKLALDHSETCSAAEAGTKPSTTMSHFLIILCLVILGVWYVWYCNQASSNPTFRENPTYLKRYNQELEKLVEKYSLLDHRMCGKDTNSPRAELQVFGKALLYAWSSGEDSPISTIASLQISGDDKKLMMSVISDWTKMLSAVGVEFDTVTAGDDADRLLDTVNSILREKDSEAPVVIVVMKAHTDEVVVLKHHLDAAKLEVDKMTGEKKFFRGIGFVFAEDTMQPTDCHSMALEDYDFKKLGWYKKFADRIVLKTRLCSPDPFTRYLATYPSDPFCPPERE